jgi:DNA-directed RNA polymerase specialized sigma24 family protein
MCNDAGLRVRALLEQANVERESGRTDAMEALLKEFLPRVDKYLKRCLGPSFDDGARQNLIFEAMWPYVLDPGLYDPVRPFSALIFSAARNNAARSLRRRRSHELCDPQSVAMEGSYTDAGPRQVDAKDALDAISQKLSPVDQKILYEPKDNWAWAQALAKDLKMTPNSVAKRWNRLRLRVKGMFSTTGGRP